MCSADIGMVLKDHPYFTQLFKIVRGNSSHSKLRKLKKKKKNKQTSWSLFCELQVSDI